MGDITDLKDQKAKSEQGAQNTASCGTMLNEEIQWKPDLAKVKEVTPAAVKPRKRGPIRTLKIALHRYKMRLFNMTIRPVRDYFYRQQSKRPLGELFALGLDLSHPHFHVMIDHSGHTNHLRIDVFPKGYDGRDKPGGERFCILDDYLPGYKSHGRTKPHHIKDAMTLLIALSRLRRVRQR